MIYVLNNKFWEPILAFSLLLFLWSKEDKLICAMKRFLPPREIQFKIDTFLTREGKKG